jgi:hypothetical protein
MSLYITTRADSVVKIRDRKKITGHSYFIGVKLRMLSSCLRVVGLIVGNPFIHSFLSLPLKQRTSVKRFVSLQLLNLIDSL